MKVRGILNSMFYVYVLKNEQGKLYYGFTHDLRRRLLEHNGSGQKRFTRNHTWQLAYYEAYLAEADARLRERKLKDYGQARSRLKQRLSNSLS